MKQLNKVFGILATLLLFSSCNVQPLPENNNSRNQLSSRIHKTWATADRSVSVNLSGATMDGSPFPAKYSFNDGGSCTCAFSLKESSESTAALAQGSITVTNCSAVNGNGNAAAYFCPYLTYNGGTYQLNSQYLYLCGPTESTRGCLVFY